MPVILGSARHDENGKYVGGKAGDQLQGQANSEVSAQEYYQRTNGRWRIVRANNDIVRQNIAQCMRFAVNSEYVGYNQNSRDSLYNVAKQYNFNIGQVKTYCNTDCSALVRVCCCYAGVNVRNFTTVDCVSTLVSTGQFTEIPFSDQSDQSVLRVGDILCTASKGHVVVVISISGVVPKGGVYSEGTAGSTYNGGSFLDSAVSSVGNTLSSAASAVLNGVKSAVDAANDFTNFLKSLASATIYDYSYKVNYETVTQEIVRDVIKSVDSNGNGGYTNLLSYPSLVETPFVLFKVGSITFGKYVKDSPSSSSGSIEYPNYIENMVVTKVSGKLNKYTITLSYQVDTGSDPNLLDKVFSSVGYGKVYISYGDYSSPAFIYKEEEAILTKVSTAVDFTNNRIMYTVECTSSAALLSCGTFNFAAVTDKPSNVIRSVLNNQSYGLYNVFTGMTNATQVARNNLIPTDDKSIEIPAKEGIDPLSYINYLVSCMSASTNSSNEPLKDSTYHIAIYDDTSGKLSLNGTYFKITKISSSEKSLANVGVYDIDVGFPSDNQVMSFNINNDNSWNLLYKYSDGITQPKYTYRIDNKGNLVEDYSPSIATSTSENKMTEAQKSWWTNMTQFPIEATLTLKGLVRSTLLMTYIRVNVLFYGKKHITSGLYIITGQKDTIDGGGYKTTLSLTRIAGDNDYIQKVKTTVTSVIPTGVTATRYESKSNGTSKGFLDSVQGYASNVTTSSYDISSVSYGRGDTEHGGSGRNFVNGEKITNTGIYSNSIATSDVKGYVWKVLKQQGCTDEGAAGAMGNFMHEGGYDPKTTEYSFCKGLRENGILTGSNSEIAVQITNMMDSGQLTPDDDRFTFRKSWGGNGKYYGTYWGYGMVQWTTSSRKAGLYNKARSLGMSVGDITAQCLWMIDEMRTSYKSVWNTLCSTHDIDQACKMVYSKYEAPTNDSSYPRRLAAAQQIYKEFKGK